MTPEAGHRQFVADMYPGRRWKKKVERMSDAQVFAIWKKAQDKKDPPKPKPKQDDIPF